MAAGNDLAARHVLKCRVGAQPGQGQVRSQQLDFDRFGDGGEGTRYSGAESLMSDHEDQVAHDSNDGATRPLRDLFGDKNGAPSQGA